VTDITFHDYEVEVVLMVTAPNVEEARAALNRSGIATGALVGEALIESVEVYAQEGESE
jgi:hypothetical protein